MIEVCFVKLAAAYRTPFTTCRFLSFRSLGGYPPPPPGRAKVAQTPGRARVSVVGPRSLVGPFRLDPLGFMRDLQRWGPEHEWRPLKSKMALLTRARPKFESLSKTHQGAKLFETQSVQYGHRYLRFFSSRIFDIGDLRSCQFRDVHIISQWGKIEVPLMRNRSAQLTQNHNQIGYA